MLILAFICCVWLFCCATAVALCVAARRGDEFIASAFRPAEPEVEVAFVATFAEAEPAPVAPRPQQRSTV